MPRQEDEKPDLLDEMIRNGPPPTLEAIAAYVADYMVALEAIKEECTDNPLLAAERTIRATKCLIAGLSPAGSPGPAHLFAPFMEIILALKTGASPAKTTLFKAARLQRSRPIDRRLQAVGDVSADGLRILARLPGDRGNGQSLAMKVEYHHLY